MTENVLQFPDKRKKIHVDFLVTEGIRGGIEDWELEIHCEKGYARFGPDESGIIVNAVVVSMFKTLISSIARAAEEERRG